MVFCFTQRKIRDLIVAMYEDKSIPKRFNNGGENSGNQSNQIWPDINKAVEELMEFVNDKEEIELTYLKYCLLDKWLPEQQSLSANDNMDETMTDFNLINKLRSNLAAASSSLEEDEDRINFWRSVYILQGFADDAGIDYLNNVAFSDDPKWSSSHKKRALQCLLVVETKFGGDMILPEDKASISIDVVDVDELRTRYR